MNEFYKIVNDPEVNSQQYIPIVLVLHLLEETSPARDFLILLVLQANQRRWLARYERKLDKYQY